MLKRFAQLRFAERFSETAFQTLHNFFNTYAFG